MPQPTPIAFPKAWRLWGFVAAMLTMTACSPPEPLRIGFLGGLSGRVADLGIGGRAVEGLLVAQYVDRENSSPTYLAFRRAYRERFSSEPGFAGLTAFDATNVALDALASRSPGQTLKQAILARGEFAGAQSPIRFGANGDTQRDTFLSVIEHGEFVAIRQERSRLRSGLNCGGCSAYSKRVEATLTRQPVAAAVCHCHFWHF